MKNLSLFCLTLNPNHEKIINELSYIPVGLGEKKFSANCFNDKEGDNIAIKNPHYGEYTFHYWIWKNYLKEIDTEWVGFCQYRKFFVNENSTEKSYQSFQSFKKNIIKSIPSNLTSYDCILGQKSYVNNYKFMKFIKQNPLKTLTSLNLIFSKNKRNIKYHFDMFHGEGNLEKAIQLLDNDHRKDFTNFVETKGSFNPQNMFICKKEILKDYYDVIFPWLKRCENIFGFKDLKGYGMTRIYGFLAERFLSYWFQKKYKVKEIPIIFKDISDYKNL